MTPVRQVFLWSFLIFLLYAVTRKKTKNVFISSVIMKKKSALLSKRPYVELKAGQVLRGETILQET